MKDLDESLDRRLLDEAASEGMFPEDEAREVRISLVKGLGDESLDSAGVKGPTQGPPPAEGTTP